MDLNFNRLSKTYQNMRASCVLGNGLKNNKDVFSQSIQINSIFISTNDNDMKIYVHIIL